MTHLTAEQFIEALDGALGGVHARHLGTCDACQRELDGMRQIMMAARADEVPEPSPLFWDHLSARVREATAATPTSGWWMRAWRPLAAIVVSAAAVALVFVMRNAPNLTPTAADATMTIADAAVDGESWGAVTEMTAKLSAGDASQLVSGSSDATAGMIADLTPAQRARFIALLKAEISKGE